MATFVAIADSAMAKQYTEVQDTQAILRPLAISSTRAGTARWAYAYALRLLANIGDIIVPDNPAQAGQVNEAVHRLVSSVRARSEDSARELKRRGMVRRSTDIGAIALDRRAASDAILAFQQASTEARQAEQEQLDRLLQIADKELQRQKTVKTHLAATLHALSNDGHPLPLDAIDHCEKALHCEVTSCGGTDTPVAVGLAALCRAPIGAEAEYDAAVELLCTVNGATPELLALVQMHAVCVSWAQGDIYMRNSKETSSSARESFKSMESAEMPHDPVDQVSVLARIDGQEALRAYQKGQTSNRCLELLCSTEGYDGHRIALSDSALTLLQAHVQEAQDEIARKTVYNDLIASGESDLFLRKASLALKGAQAISASESVEQSHTNISGFAGTGFQGAAQIAINEDEQHIAQDCIARAERELERQKRVKKHFANAIKALDNTDGRHTTVHAITCCEEALLAEAQKDMLSYQTLSSLRQSTDMSVYAVDAHDHQQCWDRLLNKEGTGDASDCTARWQGWERLHGQPRDDLTPEHRALLDIHLCCVEWARGDMFLRTWRREDGDMAYKQSRKAALAAEIGMTEGFFGPPLRLSDALRQSLDANIKRAEEAILLRKKFESLQAEAAMLHSNSKAGSAHQLSERLSIYAKSPEEIEQQQRVQQKYKSNLARQRDVKGCHESAVKALKANDPATANQCYTRAQTLETGDTPERQALVNMKEICEFWEKGNTELLEWHGLEARIAFKRCEELVKDTNIIEPTNEYAFTPGSQEFQIKLCDEYESASLTLRERINSADDEITRKDQFTQLLRDADEKLSLHQAKLALEVLGHARNVAKFGQYEERQTPDEAEQEWAQCDECVARAEAELQRQKTVKTHLAATLHALSNDGHPLPLDAIDHCEKALHCEVTSCGGTDTPVAVGLAALCRAPIGAEAEYDAAVELLCTVNGATPELLALVQMHVVCVSWAQGDIYMRNSKETSSSARESFKSMESAEMPHDPVDQVSVLARIDGQEALRAYEKSERAAQNAVNVEVTKGYADSNGEAGSDDLASDSINLTPNELRQLQICLENSRGEILRKNEFNEHIKQGECLLANRQAKLSFDQHFTMAKQKAINEDESDVLQECIVRATAELERQRRVKDKFAEAIHCLENDCAPQAANCIEEALGDESRVRWGGTPKEERIPEHLLGEHCALQDLLSVCQSWIEGDTHLNAWSGRDAEKAYTDCAEAAEKAAQRAKTEGYDGVKLELSQHAHKELQRRLESAADEIKRQSSFEAQLRAGTESWSVATDDLEQLRGELEQLSEAELEHRAREAGVGQEVLDQAMHGDDKLVRLQESIILTKLFGKNDRCPAHLVQSQRRFDGVVALQNCRNMVAHRVESDGSAEVHTVVAFESHYLVAYQGAKNRGELDAIVKEMDTACLGLGRLLDEERTAHEQRAREAQIYFTGCEIDASTTGTATTTATAPPPTTATTVASETPTLFELLNLSIQLEKKLDVAKDKRKWAKSTKVIADIDADIEKFENELAQCQSQFASLDSDGLRAASLLSALCSVAEWSVDEDLTAKHLDERVDLALSTLTTLEEVNDEIRDSAAVYAPKPDSLDTFHECDEEERSSDEEMEPEMETAWVDSRPSSSSMARTESTRLELLISERNGHRRRFIDHGDTVIHAQQQLLPLRARQREFLKDIGAALLHIRRQRRSLLYSGKALRIFQMRTAALPIAHANEDGVAPRSWNHIVENGKCLVVCPNMPSSSWCNKKFAVYSRSYTLTRCANGCSTCRV
eukprot:COSAG01_NODE_452_length_16879_cov_474.367223_6_plen_1770_part_00